MNKQTLITIKSPALIEPVFNALTKSLGIKAYQGLEMYKPGMETYLKGGNEVAFYIPTTGTLQYSELSYFTGSGNYKKVPRFDAATQMGALIAYLAATPVTVKLNEEYTASFLPSDDFVTVGCQKISKANIRALVKALDQ